MQNLSLEKKVFCLFCFVVFLVFCRHIILRIERNERYEMIKSISVTIPEGFDLDQIATVFSAKLSGFDKNNFLAETKNSEGYLFPDTYFFLNNANDADVLKSMSDNFVKKISPLLPEIVSAGKTENDVIIMASLIEREAKGNSDRDIISGILWKRISLGIPLEVDSAPETYKIKGLPENPICNPGLDSIKAAIEPQNSPYLYYLHDKNGVIHYAESFAEHQANIKKYL
ncbi:MAG: endolytic transglycosylase MltG [Minisyncoccia bacterium]